MRAGREAPPPGPGPVVTLMRLEGAQERLRQLLEDLQSVQDAGGPDQHDARLATIQDQLMGASHKLSIYVQAFTRENGAALRRASGTGPRP